MDCCSLTIRCCCADGHGGGQYCQRCLFIPADPFRPLLFTARANATGIAGHVRRIRAGARSPVESVLDRRRVPDLDKWVVFVPPENAEAVRTRSSPPAPEESATIPTAVGASPAPASFRRRTGVPGYRPRRPVERVVEDRVEVIAPARARRRCRRDARRASLRGTGIDIVALAPLPADVGLGRIGSTSQSR